MSHPFDPRPPSQQLLEFCEDSYPLVKRAMRDAVTFESLPKRERGGRNVTLTAAKEGFHRGVSWRTKFEHDVTTYVWSQSFFYPSGIYVGRDNLASGGALEFLRSRGYPEAAWRMSREDQLHVDPGKRQGPLAELALTGAKLILEHVWTGGMAWDGCMALYRQGILSPGTLAELIHSNYCSAWVLRTENKALEKTERGSCLSEALSHYRSKGISLYRESDMNPVNP